MKKIKGYKVTDENMKCRGFQYELNKEFIHNGAVRLCDSGFHFCEQAASCFNYESFNPKNRVFEVEAYGSIDKGEDKHASEKIIFLKELSWEEVLKIVNTGIGNSGLRNSGNSNSGDSNSGHWNSGDGNSGDRNSGDWNSGGRNSGDSNSGYSNSGHWNSGDGNSGDSNSGYRNSGAFCTDNNPVVYLFDRPTDILVRDWEDSYTHKIMERLETDIWVDESLMSDSEKEKFPTYKTTGGYLKSRSLKDAWADLWGNLDSESKKVFTDLPNFDAVKFYQITGIKININ